METFPHNEYPKRCRKMSDEALKFVIRDCQEAMRANPEAEKSRNGWYADEINYASMELADRYWKRDNK